MRASLRFISISALTLGFVLPLRAQRPVLFTENPKTLGEGKFDIGFGFEYLKKNRSIPLKAPIWLLRVPDARTYIGVSDIIDVLIDWRGRLFAEQGTGTHVSDWGDARIGTKINFLKETRSQPSFAIMYLVKLPSTKHDELLGSNQTDFYLSFLAAKEIGDIQLRASLGFGILDDPEHPHTQLDIYTMGAAFLLPLGEENRLFIEWTGFLGSHRDQTKFATRCGIERTILNAHWSAFGSFRVIGDEKDFGTAFEYSEGWGVGLFVWKEFSLW